MKKKLKQFIIEELGGQATGTAEVLQTFESVTVKRGQVLVELDSVCRYCYFVVRGCLKTTSYDYDGGERTTHLAFENAWRTIVNSFTHGTVAKERLVAVEEGELLRISRDDFKRLSERGGNFQKIYNRLLEQSYSDAMERIQTLMSLDALERLHWLLARHPFIFTRLSNRLIASYLGMSESTLSRLKAKL